MLVGVACIAGCSAPSPKSSIGVGAVPEAGAVVYLDGSKSTLDANWAYWKGPRLKATMPVKWEEVNDPVDAGTAISANDPSAAGGLYGAAERERSSATSECMLNF